MTRPPYSLSPDAARLAQKYDLYPDFPEVCLRMWPDPEIADLICALAAKVGEQLAYAAIRGMHCAAHPQLYTQQQALAESEYAI